MPTYTLIATVLWVILVAYWIISALASKKTIRNKVWSRGILIRFGFALVIYLFLRYTPGSYTWFTYIPSSTHPILGLIGVILVFVGVSLAIWARAYLGTNWGMPMSLKENPELVTTGPYAYIRNPIYTGILVAMLGSAAVFGVFWVIVFVFAGMYFIYSAVQEEKIMAKEFPETYPEYKKRTKMLVPFVF